MGTYINMDLKNYKFLLIEYDEDTDFSVYGFEKKEERESLLKKLKEEKRKKHPNCEHGELIYHEIDMIKYESK